MYGCAAGLIHGDKTIGSNFDAYIASLELATSTQRRELDRVEELLVGHIWDQGSILFNCKVHFLTTSRKTRKEA